jgi:hypothetical protein
MGDEDIPETTIPGTEAELLPLAEAEEFDRKPTDIPPGIEIPPDPTATAQTPQTPSSPVNYNEEEVQSLWPILLTAIGLGGILGAALCFLLLTNVPALFGSSKAPSPQTQNPRKTQVLLDYGFRDDAETGAPNSRTANDRIANAKTAVIWVTNFPTDPFILQALKNLRDEKNLVVVIALGRNADPKNASLAKKYGLFVAQSKIDLEDPNSMLIVDFKTLLDISRSRTVWETSEPDTLQQAKEWVNDYLLKDASPL